MVHGPLRRAIRNRGDQRCRRRVVGRPAQPARPKPRGGGGADRAGRGRGPAARARALGDRPWVDAATSWRRSARCSRSTSATPARRWGWRSSARSWPARSRAAVGLLEPERRRQRPEIRQRLRELAGIAPPRSIRNACIPSASAPSMSSSTESPTIAASAGSTPSRSSAARKIDSCGLIQPCRRELSAQSTSRPMVRHEVVDLAVGVRDQAELQRRVRAASAITGNASSYRSKLAESSQSRVNLVARSRARSGLPAHLAEDALRQRVPELLVVTQLGIPRKALGSPLPTPPDTARRRARTRGRSVGTGPVRGVAPASPA